MPESFHFPTRETQLWTPFNFTAQSFEDRNDNWLEVIARLRPGVSFERAAADLALTNAQLVRKYPKELEKTGTNLVRVRDEISQRSRGLLLALCGAAACILLLACANLASLLLARAIGREREMAVRAALGAGRERLVRQLVTESVALAALGGAAGVAVASIAIPMLSRLVPNSLPIAQQPTLDARILAFAALVVGATGLAFGLVPALRAGGVHGFSGLRSGPRGGGGRRQRLRGVLVAIEVAVSVVLLVSSGLLVRAMWRLQRVDPGFRCDGVLTLRTALPWPKYATTRDRAAFYDRVLASVRALPGVQHAAYISDAPMTLRGGIWPVVIKGTETTRDDAHTASLRFVTPDFFGTLGIPVLRGRDVETTDDTTRTWVAVVSASFARRYWPNEEPIGKRFTFAFHERTIVGVVGDIRVRGLEVPSEPQVYLPYKQVEDSSLIGYPPKDLLIRATATPATLMPVIRRIVRAADPEQPISDVRMLSDLVADQMAPRAAQLRVLGALAVIALLLAGIGIHGLLSFTVSSRAQEIGVRLALGAQPAGIVRMIVAEALVLAIAGIVPGVLTAYAGGRAMESLLMGVRPNDLLATGGAVLLCGMATIFGCARPALRAARVDPMTALRNE
jgi:predicted permease